MSSNILPRASLPLMTNQRLTIQNIYNPILNNRNISGINGNTLNNNLSFQQNINPNLNKINGVNNSYNNIAYNNYSIGKINNSKSLTNLTNKSLKANKNKLYSSGTLIPSKKERKYNTVRKGTNEIKNIDINNEDGDIENKPDIITINPLNKNIALTNETKLGSEMIPQNTNHMLRTVDTGISNGTYKLNPIARFINYIIDKINPNLNKSTNHFNPYDNNINTAQEPIPLNSAYNEIDNKSSQIANTNINNIYPTDNDIKKTPLNSLNNEPNLKDKSITVDLSKNNTSTTDSNLKPSINNNNLSNSNNLNNNKNLNYSNNLNNNNNLNINNKLNNQPTQATSIAQNPNLQNKNPTLSSNKTPLPLSSNNDKSNLTRSTTKNEDKRSESKVSISKFPFQSLNTVGNSINLSNINRVPLDSYLPTNLGGKGFKCCCQITQAGKGADGNLKVDQDTSLIHESIGGIIGFNMFGVLDGHGPHGHFVSQFCKEYFINSITRYTELLKIQKRISNAEQIYNEFKINKFALLTEFFTRADIEIANQRSFDSTISGTTCNIVFQFNNHLVCCSVGDSRCIIVYDKGDKLNQGIIPLSTDHKPDLPGELERIRLYGGEVDHLKDLYGNKIGPSRVFKIGSEYPGLAMSRSLGDLLAKQVGVISSPQIIEYDVNFSTKYLIICSDGVWEFSSNEKVRDVANAFYIKNDINGLCTNLVKYAMSLWEQIEVIRDDITVVSVFF